jgi:hypothetical protein
MTAAIETKEPLAWPGLGPPPPAVKPPRLNFAHVCLRCERRHCDAPECMRWYARSRWMVCPDCDGTSCANGIEPCGCLFGVVEARVPAASPCRAGALPD